MPFIYTLPKSTSFTGTGLEGYNFGPLAQTDLDIFYVQSEKGHDTFMISRKITRTYYVLSGSGYFTIGGRRYEARKGMLVEVPPRIEFSYSGKMTLLGFSRPRWFRGNDLHTRWNPDVTDRDPSCLPGRESWTSRLIGWKIAGRSPAGVFLGLNRRLWRRLPSSVSHVRAVLTYGKCVHALARRLGAREQAFSTCFFRNRPQLQLLRRLLDLKGHGETLRVAVVACSMGAEAYSIAWSIRTARPDLKLVLTAVDISRQAVEFASRGVYSLINSDVPGTDIFERMTAPEKEELFETDAQTAVVRPWIKEGIKWQVGDAGEPGLADRVGPQDIVVANNFLCHMPPAEAERCLRNIVRLVSAGGYLFVSGIDLDVRTKVATDLGWKPVEELLEEIHEGDSCLRVHWPWHYGGLEPLDKRRADWKVRYAAAFQPGDGKAISPARQEDEFAVAN